MNAAHYLVLGDKETYQFDPEVPFLHMVSSTPGSTGDLLVCVVPSKLCMRVFLLPSFPVLG